VTPWAAALAAAERRGYEHAWAEVCRHAEDGDQPAGNVGELVAAIVGRLQDEHIDELAGVRQAERDRIAAALQRRGAVTAAAVVRGLADQPLLLGGQQGGGKTWGLGLALHPLQHPLHLCGENCQRPGAHG
jgi:hypothetical protein